MILNFMPDIRKWILPALLAIVCQQSIHWVIDFSLGNMEVIPIQHLKVRHTYIEKEIYYDKFYSGLLKEYLLWTFSKFTIHEIVFKSGFSNRTSFYRAFLKKNGCTPKEFIEVNKGR